METNKLPKPKVPNLEHFEAFKQTLVQELEQLRKQSGATQKTVATVAGITRKRVMRQSDFEDIQKVANALGVETKFDFEII